MKNKKSKKFELAHFYGLVLILAVAVFLIFFYIENTKGFVKIDSSVQTDGLKVFVDNSTETIKDSQISVKEGHHILLISKENYWPWVKEIDISKKQIIDIDPFFVPKETSGYIITKTHPEYNNILLKFWQKTHIDWDKNEYTPDIIKNFETDIRASDFYKDRNDVIIVAVQNGIYALEINSSSTPNFQPIYKGNEPTFVKKDDNTLYVKDGNNLMEVNY